MILRIPARLTPYILQPRVWLVCAWAAAAIATAAHAHVAWHSYDTLHEPDPSKRRADNNYGHTLIDFGGQWLAGRLVASGRGGELYLRSSQREVADAAFPRADEAPDAAVSDAENLVGWMVEVPDVSPAIGGPLYPPTQALLFAPLGALTPRMAYRSTQIATLVLTWLCGWLLSRCSGGRFPWPVTSLLVMGYPGFVGALHLGQNSVMSLAILAGGWLLLARGRPFTAGLVWGLLAYKPTWAVAFALVPLLTRRWRMLLGMGLSGGLFVAATLPVVGIGPWFQWLQVGKWASHSYGLDENWVFLSRDLQNIPIRWLLDFRLALSERERPAAAAIGLCLWAIVLAVTIVRSQWNDRTALAGPAAAFVGLGAWLSCYHFIYYDVLLSALPVVFLMTDRRHSFSFAGIDESGRMVFDLNLLVMSCVAFLVAVELAFPSLAIEITVREGVPLLSTKQHGTPWDTFALLVLWAYCAVVGDRPETVEGLG